MKKLVLISMVLLLVGSSLFAGGAACRAAAAKTVALTGTIACSNGSTGADCARVFRVANNGPSYTICKGSKVKLTSLGSGAVRVEGKLVNCNETGGQELVIEKLSKI